MYEVVSDFYDAKNDGHFYAVGDKYPVNGNKPSKARIEELAKGKNKYGRVFIKEVQKNPSDEDKTPDQTGGEDKTPDQTEE